MKKPSRFLRIILTAAAAVTAACTTDAPNPQTIAFTGATVWDGTGSPRREADILVEEGRIVEVGDVGMVQHGQGLGRPELGQNRSGS